MIPISNAREKFFKLSPPKRYRANTENRVVPEVMIVLAKFSLILWFTSCRRFFFPLIFIFSLILSKIIIVSFRE